MVKVRRLDPDDLVAFRALNALFAEVFDLDEDYADAPPGDAYALDLLARDDVILLVAETGGIVVGGIGAYVLRKFEQERSEIYLYDLAVLDSHRREGIATALISELRSIARQIGSWMIFVQADTGADDAAAQALYRKLGEGEERVLHYDIAP